MRHIVEQLKAARDFQRFVDDLSGGTGAGWFRIVKTPQQAREVIRHLAVPQQRSSMAEEMIYQTFIARSDDMAELQAARAEDRAPVFTGS